MGVILSGYVLFNPVPLRKAVVSALAVSLTGCGLMHPYPEPLQQRPDLHWRAQTISEQTDHLVSTDEAIVYARSVEDAYRQQVRRLSAARTGGNASMIALATGALAVVASGGSSDLATGLGLGGGAIATGSRQIVVGVYRSLYFQGAEAIECAVGAVERVRSGPTEAQGDVLAWRGTVMHDRNKLEGLVTRSKQAYLDLGPGDREVMWPIILGAQSTVNLADRQLAFADDALTSADRLGRILVNRVESVRIRVDNEIAKAEPDLLAFDKALKEGLEGSANLFKASSNADAAGTSAPANKVMNKADVGVSDPNAQNLIDQMMEHMRSLAANGRGLVAAAGRLRGESIPADLFAACGGGPGTGATLKVEPASVTLTAGKAGAVAVLVSQGMGPYTQRKELLPTGVTVDSSSSTSSGTLYTVAIDAKAATAGAKFIVLWKDAGGREASLAIEVQKAAGTSSTPTPTVPKTATPLPAPVVSAPLPTRDAELREIQIQLAEEAISSGNAAFDPKTASGIWDGNTRRAIVAYLTENESEGTDFSVLSEHELIERARTALAL